ncbi:DUF2726 domain-containing protein [uncultured Brachyspira sp.]|uniref:DUF2726 domain-containing protein n=1 Tax=uncultured Brachyspira sp. TaxID=221953 RepID=UPI0026280949|nr:DUF2726 domain-containing protein [uncultured Brachyspira sp.]
MDSLAVLLIFIVPIILFLLFIGKIDKQTYRRPFRRYYKRKYPRKDITSQRLENMDTGNISIKKIMNIEESKIFFSMLKVFKDYNIYKQVSYKAFLDAEEDTDIWKSYRDFYSDFLITYKRGDNTNKPIAIIEYDGAGHYGHTEEMKERIKNNDLVKEQLIKKAGMKYFIIKEEDIKTNSKFIDENKLEACLYNIVNSL